MRIHPVTLEEIIKTVADFYGRVPDDLIGPSRERHLFEPRQVCWFLARELTEMSWESLAREVGRNHSSLIAGVRNARVRELHDETFRARMEHLRRRLEVEA